MKKIHFAVLFLTSALLAAFALSGELNAQSFSPFEMEKLIGKEAPEFTVTDLSGKKVSFSSFRGKPILLNFWATWCSYCRKERQYLNSLHKLYKDKGLVIVAVSTDKSSETVKRYMKKMPADFVVLHDTDNQAAEQYGVYSLPTSFLINRKGIIKHKFIGLRRWTDSGSTALFKELLKE